MYAYRSSAHHFANQCGLSLLLQHFCPWTYVRVNEGHRGLSSIQFFCCYNTMVDNTSIWILISALAFYILLFIENSYLNKCRHSQNYFQQWTNSPKTSKLFSIKGLIFLNIFLYDSSFTFLSTTPLFEHILTSFF